MPNCERRRSRWSLVAVALAVLAAGCATVPTSGPVAHHTQQVPNVEAGVHVDPLPPAENASQLLVVEGFLHAMSTYQPNYAVARQYLTEEASATWKPESGVEIYGDGYPPTEGGQTVMLQAPRVGSLDRSGAFTAATGQTPDGIKHDFEPVQDANGQWRISNPPAGLLVSRYVFTSGFPQVKLHYLDSELGVLVPELRYFAAGNQAMAEAVRAQLGAPSAWLAPAVQQVNTGGMSAESVSVDDTGHARVTLSMGAENLDGTERDLLLAQITATLGSFSHITSVEVSSGSQVLSTQTGLSQLDPDHFGELSPENTSAPRALVVRRGGEIVRLSESNWADTTPLDVRLTSPEQIAVRSDLGEASATTASATLVQSSAVGEKARTVRKGKQLLRPDYARNGELWTLGRAGLSTLKVLRNGKAAKVEVEELPDRRLVAAKLSPDGARIALVFQAGEGTEVGLAVVARHDNQIRLTRWRPLSLVQSPGTSAKVLDVGWASPTQIASLQRTVTGDTSVIRLEQDSSSATDIGPTKTSSLVRLSVVPGRKAVALTGSGNGYRFEGEFDWSMALTAVDDVSYSG